MNRQICDAIRGRNHLTFMYKNCRCVVEPLSYGVAHSGDEILQAFQTSPEGEFSSSWKTYRVDDIENLMLLTSRWVHRLGNQSHREPMSKTYAEA